MSLVQFTSHFQTRAGTRRSYEIDDCGVGQQWNPPPVLADEREQPVFDFVPFAGSRRQMTDADGQPRVVGQFLQFPLPKAQPASVAATAVGGDEQRRGVRMDVATHASPPATDGRGGEGCRVMGDADTHPPGVAGQVVDSVRNGLAQLLIDEVVNTDFFWPACGPPVSA